MSAAIALRPERYPQLAALGITRFHEISRYTLRHDGRREDVLKVRYRRQKGALLPESRTYRFGRAIRTIVADGGSGRLEDSYEISPCLLAAIDELDRLAAENAPLDPAERASTDEAGAKATLLSEIAAIERLVGAGDDEGLAARFASLRRGVGAL